MLTIRVLQIRINYSGLGRLTNSLETLTERLTTVLNGLGVEIIEKIRSLPVLQVILEYSLKNTLIAAGR